MMGWPVAIVHVTWPWPISTTHISKYIQIYRHDIPHCLFYIPSTYQEYCMEAAGVVNTAAPSDDGLPIVETDLALQDRAMVKHLVTESWYTDIFTMSTSVYI